MCGLRKASDAQSVRVETTHIFGEEVALKYTAHKECVRTYVAFEYIYEADKKQSLAVVPTQVKRISFNIFRDPK